MRKMYSDLGPVVGQLGSNQIRANQLSRSGWDWQNGAGTPSDGHDTNAGPQPVRKLTSSAKNLIIFWSRSGSTKLLASKIADRIDADILEIVLKTPYPAYYNATLDRANEERLDNRPPKLNMDVPQLN